MCAVTPGDVARTGCEDLAHQVLALGAGTIRGIYDGILAVGKAINHASAAHALVANIQQRIDKTYQAVRKKSAPTVVILEWTDPIFPTGNWGPELVQAANGKLLLGGKGEHSRAISWEHVREADPDYLIVAPCGYSLDRSLREIPVLEALPGWFELSAVEQETRGFRRWQQILQPLGSDHLRNGRDHCGDSARLSIARELGRKRMAALCAGRCRERVAACACVNFVAEYEINSHMSIFGRIDNLTNEHYAEVFGFPALGRAA